MEFGDEFDEFLTRLLNMVGVYEEKTCRDISKGELTQKEFRIIESIIYLSKEGEVTIGDLSCYLFITPSSLSIAVTTLVKKGYIDRVKDSGDQRYSFLKPTEKAIGISKVHRAYHYKLFNYIYNKCDHQELRSFFSVLKQVDVSLGGE